MTQIDRLLGIMKRLRDPENGCPWDKEQTFATIAPYTLEETYEVLDAIQRKILTTCAVSWAICCSRWCSMRKWRRKRTL
jgi:NTP pyrophosphatase (non-canonical NTP hydrolase)